MAVIHARVATEDEINDMIAQENDPKVRLQLMVLQNINASLIANTKTVNDIDKQLTEHLREYVSRTQIEEAFINKGLGAWKIIAWVGGIAQAIILALIVNVSSELKALHIYDSILSERITIVEQHQPK